MPTKKFLIISIAAILGSTAFNYASVGDVRQHSSGSRSYNGSRVGGGYSSGWHK